MHKAIQYYTQDVAKFLSGTWYLLLCYSQNIRKKFSLRLRVMRLILNIIFSGVIVILAYKPTITFRFTLWLLSVMNTSIKD